MNRAVMMTFGMLFGLLLLLSACGPGETGKQEPSQARLIFHETFESAASVRQHGGYLWGEEEIAFAPGFVDNAYWMGQGNQASYPANHIIHPEQGTIEFWICPKNRWNDGQEHTILAVGGKQNFSIVKDGENNDIRVTLHGKSIGFAKVDPFAGEVYEYQWRPGWNHIAVTWRNLGFGDKGELVLQVNGEVRNQMVNKLPRIDNHDPLILGELTDGSAPDALIDELKIYNYSRPYWEFENVTADKTLAPPYDLLVYPTPHPAGMLSGEGFAINEDTKIIIGDEMLLDMDDALEALNAAIEAAYGFTLDVSPASENPDSRNHLAIGTLANNSLLSMVSRTYKLPATRENPGPGAYLLEVTPEGIAVAGGDYAGSIKGLLTLAQLIRQHLSGYFPPYFMVDYPDMGFRATVVEEGDLLTNELKQRLLYFSSLGLSHVVVDTDAYFDLDNELVAERMADVFRFIRRVGLEPVPLIHGLSNAEKIIGKCADAGIDCSENGAPDTYCPNEPYVYVVMKNAIKNTIDILAPTMIHIGHDNVKVFNKDQRCIDAGLSPIELFVDDINRIKQIIRSRDREIEVLVWFDMLDPLFHGGRLTEKAPIPDAPDPPTPREVAPRDVIWCPYRDIFQDPTIEFLYPMLVLWELNEGMYGTYTVGPTRDDMYGAYTWIRNGFDKGAIGFLHRPETAEPLTSPNWLALPVAAEYAWAYYGPFGWGGQWYDFSSLNEGYGGLFP